jgi:uncharacterized membrane protein YgaE (UPF0421/DUF939 family)
MNTNYFENINKNTINKSIRTPGRKQNRHTNSNKSRTPQYFTTRRHVSSRKEKNILSVICNCSIFFNEKRTLLSSEKKSIIESKQTPKNPSTNQDHRNSNLQSNKL